VLERLAQARGCDLLSLLPPHMQHVLDDFVGAFEGQARAHVGQHFHANACVMHVEMNPCLMSRDAAFVTFMRARLADLHAVPELVWHGTAGVCACVRACVSARVRACLHAHAC
jgi:hypothetical protein